MVRIVLTFKAGGNIFFSAVARLCDIFSYLRPNHRRGDGCSTSPMVSSLASLHFLSLRYIGGKKRTLKSLQEHTKKRRPLLLWRYSEIMASRKYRMRREMGYATNGQCIGGGKGNWEQREQKKSTGEKTNSIIPHSFHLCCICISPIINNYISLRVVNQFLLLLAHSYSYFCQEKTVWR